MRRDKPKVLVVDIESPATKSLIAFLRDQGMAVVWSRDQESAIHVLDEEPVDCLVTELRGQRIDGLAVLGRARERNPEVCGVVITAGADVDIAVTAMRQGAYDFQVKPLNLEKLLAVLQRGLSHQRLAARVAEIEGQLDERFGIDRLTGHSRAMTRVLEQVRHLASTRATVLIEGETGTGKGLVAQVIHHNSPRRNEPFVWVNCGALAEGVIDSELFGHERGAFTGASDQRRGRFELADGGTLFLDEVSEAPPSVQVKLLRVLQDRIFERVGGQETLRVDVRLIAASDRDLEQAVQAGRFRADLFYRLGVVRIAMPPLRERREDIPLLIEAFLRRFNREQGRRVAGITRGALERLARYAWPGNVRELRNVIEGMVVFAEGRRLLDLGDLPPHVREVAGDVTPLAMTVGMTVAEAERELIVATLQHAGHDKTRAAAMLGIGLRTLYRKIQRYGIR